LFYATSEKVEQEFFTQRHQIRELQINCIVEDAEFLIQASPFLDVIRIQKVGPLSIQFFSTKFDCVWNDARIGLMANRIVPIVEVKELISGLF